MTEVKKSIEEKLKVKDMGQLNHFLGVKVVQKKESGDISIGQELYTKELVKKFQVDQSKPVATPFKPGSKLIQEDSENQLFDQKIYQSAVGSLLYLSTRTWPDIMFAVRTVARFCEKLTKQHWIAVKRILRYLNGSQSLGLLYSKDKEYKCIGYSEADWAGDLEDRKSTLEYVLMICGGAISWKSKKQTCVALATKLKLSM